MCRSLLSEEICPNLCVYMVFMNINFLDKIFLNMNMLFFFMFSFIELPFCAARHFSMIFLINAYLEEDVFIRREALKKVNISSLNQALPKLDQWQGFPTNDRNKEQLCSLLANYFVSDEIVTGKTIYVTKGSLCLMKTLHNGQQMVNELCSNHREADHKYAQS